MKNIQELQIQSFAEYKTTYQESVDNPEAFWANVADHFTWRTPWKTVLDWDFTKPEVKWFAGATLNITENALDTHAAAKGNQTAIIWEPNNPDEESRHISYRQLLVQVMQFANVLKNNGIQKGDRVCLYMPMIPELAIAMLACARIGAVHSIVFAGFSSKALADRINDANCKMLITANEMHRGTKLINVKKICDDALESSWNVFNFYFSCHFYFFS